MTEVRIWINSGGRSFTESAERSWEAGSESGTWLVEFADEFGNGGTGGRFRTGVEGACVAGFDSRRVFCCV